jgi:hypothetical protein
LTSLRKPPGAWHNTHRMADIGAWIVALLEHWAGALAALPFIALGVAERSEGKPLLARRWYIAAVAAAFLGANFYAWRDQRADAINATAGEQTAQEQAGDLQSRLNDQKDYNTPDIQVSLQNVWFFKRGKNNELYMVVDVRNTGADSIADYWEVYIYNSSHTKEYVLPLHRIDNPFSFPTVAGKMLYKPSYWLPDRTLPDPVRRGGDIKGILVSIFRGPDQKTLDLNSIIVTFNDVNGDTHSAMNVVYQVNTGAVSPPTLDR